MIIHNTIPALVEFKDTQYKYGYEEEDLENMHFRHIAFNPG